VLAWRRVISWRMRFVRRGGLGVRVRVMDWKVVKSVALICDIKLP
jgi:hypothetical protein